MLRAQRSSNLWLSEGFEGFEKRGKTTAYDICGPCGPVFGVVYSPPLSSRRLPCCQRHLSTPRRDTPRPLYVRGISDAPNILLDKSAYHPFRLHFPCRGCLNPHLHRQSARDAARRTLSTTDCPEFVRADATATRKCKNTDSYWLEGFPAGRVVPSAVRCTPNLLLYGSRFFSCCRDSQLVGW